MTDVEVTEVEVTEVEATEGLEIAARALKKPRSQTWNEAVCSVGQVLTESPHLGSCRRIVRF
jgi:hypothetical protein